MMHKSNQTILNYAMLPENAWTRQDSHYILCTYAQQTMKFAGHQYWKHETEIMSYQCLKSLQINDTTRFKRKYYWESFFTKQTW